MEDQKILQHLLDLENQAAALVNDAQAEADRRAAEGENQNRSRYDESCARTNKALEEEYDKNIEDVKTQYRQNLELYRNSLKTMPRNYEAFSALAEKFLLAPDAPKDALSPGEP